MSTTTGREESLVPIRELGRISKPAPEIPEIGERN